MENMKSEKLFLKLKAIILTILMIVVALSAFTVQSVEENTSGYTLSNEEQVFDSVISEPGFREYVIDDNRLVYKASFPEPHIIDYVADDKTFSTISMPNTFSIGSQAGYPIFPAFPLKILLPYQKEISDIIISGGCLIEVKNQRQHLQDHPIVPYQEPVPFGSDPVAFVFDEKAYESLEQYPDALYASFDVDHCKGYPILTLNLFPTKYEPGNNNLFYFNDIIIDIKLQDADSDHPMLRDNPNDKAYVSSLVSNPEMVSTYADISFSRLEGYPSGICDPADSYDYVIITREILSDFTDQEYTWTDFINKKQAQGLQTILVTVEEIIACEDYWNTTALFNDTAALIREFLRDAYQDWGISYVLIAGDHNGPAAIPRRLMSYAYESHIASDLYWSNLDKTFNDNQNNHWGEEGDTGFDLYSELFIGSLSCDEPVDISNWMKKSFYYADSTEKEYLENVGFYGGFLGWHWETGGDDFMDFTLYGTDSYLGPNPDYSGPWPNWFGFLQGFDTWNASNPGYEFNITAMWTAESSPNPGWDGGSESVAIAGLKDAINNNKITILNGIAHANAHLSLDVHSSSWETEYHNTKPFFLHDYGCHNGDMTATDKGVLHSMLFHSDTHLAFATVYNTGYGWGNLYSTNSSSAVNQKFFWEYLFNLSISGGVHNWQLGKAQAWSKDHMAPTIDWDPVYGTWRGIIQGCTLFGDPAQLLKIPFIPEHDILVTNLDIPSVVPHGVTQTVSALVRNIGNNTETNILVNFTVNETVLDTEIIPFLDSMESTTVSFSWDPDYGIYLVGIDAAFVPDEYDLTNNQVNKTVEVIPAPVIQVTPDSLGFMAPTNALDSDVIVIENLPVAEATLSFDISFSGYQGGNWLSADIMNGDIPIDDSLGVTITVNTTGLDEGSYQGYVIVSSNDIITPVVMVPVDLTVVYGHDMRVVSINSPVGTVPFGEYVVNATVQNLGFYPQSDVVVNCSIFEGGIGGVVLDEDFSSYPDDWTITHVQGTAWSWSSSNQRMENSYGYPNSGYLDSPILDCSGKSGMSLSFWHDWYATWSGGTQNGYVRGSIDGGSTFPYLIAEFFDQTTDTGIKQYDISSWADGQSGVVIRFDVYNNNNWWWYVDDVNVSAEITGPLVYSAEESVSLDAYESIDVLFSPSWLATGGTYGIQVTTLLDGDENPSNDVKAAVVYVEGPSLAFAPDSFDFGLMMVNTTDSTSFEIWNGNVGELTYVLSESCDWVSLSSYGGSVSTGVDTIMVYVDTTDLASGLHSCDINISSDGGDDVFSVSVFVVDDTTEFLDVEQELSDRGFRLMPGWDAAQEFVPSYPVLSQVDLYMTTWNNPAYPIPVEIRKDDPIGDLLFEDLIYPADVTTSFPDWGWVSVDIGTISVEVGETYVIVLRDSTDDDFNHLMWGVYTSFGIPGPYPDGNMLFRKLGFPTWMPIWDFDCTFRTYGKQLFSN